MPFIVGRAAREHELYTRLKDFVTGVGWIGRSYFTGSGNGKLIDMRLPSLALAGETLTITCEAIATKGGSFGVVSSARGTLADAECNKVYLDPRVQFYLDFGSTDFALNDVFQLKFIDYSAPAKPKLTALKAEVGTKTETVTLTCTTAGLATIPGVQVQAPAVFSVVGSVSGNLGNYTQGTDFSSTAVSFTLDRGDVANATIQFALGETITIHTTQNELTAVGQQWTTQRDPKQAAGNQFGVPIPENDSEWIFKGPGLSGTDEILCGIRRSWSNSAGTAAWELAGMRGYGPGLTYNEQANILPSNRRPNLLMWSGELTYWLSVTGRKITLKVRNNTYYMDLYLGLGIPWGSPKYQPYFLCIGGSSGDEEGNWTNLSVANSNYWAPRCSTFDRSPMQVLNRDGNWQGHLVRANNGRGDSWSEGGWINSNSPSVWPYRGNGMQKVRENLDGSTPLFPVTLIPDMGELEGIMAFSGYGNVQPEDLVWMPTNGKKYVVGTNTYRNSTEDFMGMELI